MISEILRLPNLRDGNLLARLRRRRLALIVALFGLLAIIAFAMVSVLSVQREARDHALHELRSIQVLRTMLEAILDAETSQRGYLLTGKDSYLEPFATARQALADARSGAEGLIAHSPYFGERTSIDPLERLLDDKMNEVTETVALARTGKREEAMFIVGTDFGKRRMDAVRQEIGRLAAGEELHFTRANERALKAGQLLIPLVLALGLLSIGLVLIGLRAEQARAQIEAEAAQAAALREANIRGDLLVRELNHRVKNLFSIILSIITLASRRRPESRDLIDEIKARIHALSRAHSLAQGPEIDHVDLKALLEAVLAPYDDGETQGRVTIKGPSVRLPARSLTPMGLVLHELATNAVKYGALSNAEGTVTVSWQCIAGDEQGPFVDIRWTETGLPPGQAGGGTEQATGFGTTLIDRASMQMGSPPRRTWSPTGLVFEFTCAISQARLR